MRQEQPDELDSYLESHEFSQSRHELITKGLLIPSASVRKALTLVADRMDSSCGIGRRLGVNGYRVALDQCEYAREVIGRYLRGQRARPAPVQIQRYWREARALERDWEKLRKEREREDRRKYIEEQNRLKNFKPTWPPPSPFPDDHPTATTKKAPETPTPGSEEPLK